MAPRMFSRSPMLSWKILIRSYSPFQNALLDGIFQAKVDDGNPFGFLAQTV